MSQGIEAIDLWKLIICYIHGWSYIWDGFKHMFMLQYKAPSYSRVVPVNKAHIWIWEKYYRHLGIYSLRSKEPCEIFTKEKPYELGYQYELGVRWARTSIL